MVAGMVPRRPHSRQFRFLASSFGFDMVWTMHAARPPITHRHVEVFRALMTAGSVTAAAQSLATSQPTVSRELARLEQLLQLVLFDRVRGRLRPTAQAWALFDEV